MSESNDRPSPETDVEPVTVERVSELLTAENLEHRTDSAPMGTEGKTMPLVRTGFDNVAITFAVDQDSLICEGLWRGVVPRDRSSRVLVAVNQWNQVQIGPTLRFFEQGEGDVVISGIRHTPVGDGADRNQLGSFVLSSMEQMVAACTEMERQFPELVTWTEDHHDHA